MNAAASSILVLVLLLQPTQGGNCWSAMVRNGRCTELLNEKVSKEECCASESVSTAWSSEDMDAGTLFFWRVLGGGVPCYACKESCAGVDCGEGKKCEVRRGRPKCVCSPDCRKSRHKGPVCGTDGRSYRSVCRLRKRACRRDMKLAVAYYGHCQSSCDRIRCPAGKHCLLDQNLSPHCVKCAQRCPPRPAASRQVCGTDGVTYQSACHLQEAACHKGKAIPVAYKGRCKQMASCGSVRCRDRQSCLTELNTGTPRCVTCSYRCPRPRSPSGMRRDMGGPICGTNNRTYHSWCHMLKDACATGFVIETKFSGSCDMGGAKPTVANTVLDEASSIDRYS
ncbi:follistatin [Periplaneta americana]|uniref:follistatin n=1 Tax=Periplaneta americana TaxID=6978 RepID=UPI0037E6F99D